MKITKRQLRRIIKEAMAGTLFIERGGYGYIALSDDGGNEWTLGQAISQLIDNDIVNFFNNDGRGSRRDEASLKKMLKQDAKGVQGGLARWDSDVFSEYYNVDPERVIEEFAKLMNYEIVEAKDTTDSW